MIVTKTVEEMQQLSKKFKSKNNSIGYVATMGFLHEGHLSLVNEAKKHNDIVVMSIFVNPTQFGPNEDFETYPRNFEKDRSLAAENGVDVLFYPSVSEMYPSEVTSEIHVVKRTNVLCGQSRPGHFNGVATVLFKLFHIILPDAVYFGMKDAQQVAVIEGFLNDYFFPIRLIACPTKREPDGLAMSSRNVNLTEEERKEASIIYELLQKAKKLVADGERNTEHLRKTITNKLSSAITGKIDYAEILTFPNLTSSDTIVGEMIFAIAIQYSQVRLIDNIILSVKEEPNCIEQ